MLKSIKKESSGTAIGCLFLLTVFVLGLNRIHDTDSWLHLSLGRLIWDLKAFPVREMFTYPSADMEFSYSSWLFGILVYGVYLGAKSQGLVLLKASVFTAAFALLLQDSLKPFRSVSVSIFSLILAVLACRYRFVLRPDMFMILFMAATIFCLNAFFYEGRKYLYILPLVSLFWANMHSSINLIFVPFGAYLVGGLLQQKFFNKRILLSEPPSTAQLKVILIVFLFSLGATVLTPYGLDQFSHGSQYYVTEWYRQEIAELLPPIGATKILLVVMDAALLASFAMNGRRISLVHLLLTAPFLCMPFISVRYMILLAIVGGPVFARNISQFISFKFPAKRAGLSFFMWPVGGFLVILLLGVPFKRVPFSMHAYAQEFGFDFDYGWVPHDAVEFMDREGIDGRVLNPFAYGQYIIWTGYPQRTVFIDARGVLSPAMLEKASLVGVSASVVDELYAAYKFDSILLPMPSFAKGTTDSVYRQIDSAFSNPEWALVYWDDKSMLFLKKDGRYDHIIKKDAYQFIQPDMSAHVFIKSLGGYDQRQKILAELQRNSQITQSYRASLFMGILHFASARYDAAIQSFSRVEESDDIDLRNNAFALMGDVYFTLRNFDKSLENYQKAEGYEEVPNILVNIGEIYAQQGESAKAIGYYEKALELDAAAMGAYPKLIAAYESAGKAGKAELLKQKYNSLNSTAIAKAHFINAVKAHQANQLDLAIVEYNKSLDVDANVPVIYANLGFIYLDKGTADKAFEYFTKAVRLDDGFANAYYGLALVYKEYGERNLAVENFAKYCELQPTGAYYRRAKEEIRELQL